MVVLVPALSKLYDLVMYLEMQLMSKRIETPLRRTPKLSLLHQRLTNFMNQLCKVPILTALSSYAMIPYII